MLENIIYHYKKEDSDFIKYTNNLLSVCSNKKFIKITDFLEPNKQKIISDLCKRYNNINCKFIGGFDTYERAKAIIYPIEQENGYVDEQITIIKILPTDKNAKLRHGDFLGAILGLGIKREKIGDVKVDSNMCYVAVDTVLSNYIKDNLFNVGKYNVVVNVINDYQDLDIKEQHTIVCNTVASPRLDSILKIAYNLSRSKAADYIIKGLVKHNWNTVTNVSQTVNINDIISLRGKGRIKILDISYKNKTSRYNIKLEKYN